MPVYFTEAPGKPFSLTGNTPLLEPFAQDYPDQCLDRVCQAS